MPKKKHSLTNKIKALILAKEGGLIHPDQAKREAERLLEIPRDVILAPKSGNKS